MIACAVTDLPEPDSPTSASVEPGAMLKDMRSSAGTIVPRLSKSIDRSWTSSSGVAWEAGCCAATCARAGPTATSSFKLPPC